MATAFLACTGETVALPPPPPVNWPSLDMRPAPDAGVDIVSAKERALAEAYVRALASPDFSELGPLLDDDAHFAGPGMPDVHGQRPVVRAHDELFGAFDDRHITASRVWRTPREQTIEWTLTGTQAREYGGVAATHKAVAFRGLTLLWTQDDGRITDAHVYVDVAIIKAQLGVGAKSLLSLSAPSVPVGPVETLEQADKPSAMELGEISQVRAWLDAFENRKEAEFVGAATGDVELTTLEAAQPARGADGLKAYYTFMHRSIGQLDTTISNAWAVGPFAIVEYFIAGEQLGPLGWIPFQRDKVIRMELVDICEIRDGKIKHIWRYDNPEQLLGQSHP
jgi:steroid delta-isomerase-like uncharacterized protein